jgi:hypothetical protein
LTTDSPTAFSFTLHEIANNRVIYVSVEQSKSNLPHGICHIILREDFFLKERKINFEIFELKHQTYVYIYLLLEYRIV